MITETLENGDYIIHERSAYPNGVWGQEIKELYTRYDKKLIEEETIRHLNKRIAN